MEQTNLNEGLCGEVLSQFAALQKQRKPLERTWELNLEFVKGNQYSRINGSGEICTGEREFEWEQRRVFNHVAPIVDTRLSKLSRIRPALAVRAASDSENDKRAAELSSAILSAVQEECDMDKVMSKATMWSEICGTAFYKTAWNFSAGKKLGESGGKGVYEGEVNVAALSPFEIYPFSLSEESVEGQTGIIHAKVLPVGTIATLYGVETAGKAPSEFSSLRASGMLPDAEECGNKELVLERYLKPCADLPEGRLTVVAGETLIYDGPLPYINGEGNTRGYPFIKQVSVPAPGAFFGTSIVERLIPVQRAYNAVKNRKHEFLNRIAMGTVAVEDGSVDVDELEEDGLAPGKILIYRQGGNPPQMLSLGGVPEEFWKEEESLLSEFAKISGTGELTENVSSFTGVTSATGLQLIIEQNDARLNVAYQSLKSAARAIGRHVLRLYRQFAGEMRLVKYLSGDKREYKARLFKGSDISGEDVILEADTDLNLTPAQRRTVIYELMEKGLFNGKDGAMSLAAKRKILGLLGYAYLADTLPADEEEI